MTDTALAIEPRPPLADWLERAYDDDALASLLGVPIDAVPRRAWDRALLAPLRELLNRPGKEFRSRLVAAGWELAGGDGPVPEELPLLVELLHAGSLVIDDIEDGSAYRRGAPALHCAFGLPIALNTGSLLYFWPLVLVSRLGLDAPTENAIHRKLASTLVRCHHGQALDLATRVSDLAQDAVPAAVEATTRLKTGGLTELASSLGAIATGAPEPIERALATFGGEMGVALQMLDDLGGVTSQRRRHKGHEDLVDGKLTWPWAWIAERLSPPSYARLRALARDVERRDVLPEALAETMRHLLGGRGKRHVHARLDEALDGLRSALGGDVDLGAVSSELERLEASYG